MHYRCHKSKTCADCTKESVNAGLPPLTKCEKSDVYTQLDGNVDNKVLYFPQIELLEDFVKGYPNATFLLTFRSMDKWYHSISNWPPKHTFYHLIDRMVMANITGLEPTKASLLPQAFSDWFCNHVERVRRIIPQNQLVEIDIEDDNISSQLADVFNIDEECWLQANANANIHPELNVTRAVSKFGTSQSQPWLIK